MRYQVRFVGNDDLPEGVEWVFARQAGHTYLFVKQSAICEETGRCKALSRAWQVWQDVEIAEERSGVRPSCVASA